MRRDLGGDHRAERMTDQAEPHQSQPVEQVVVVERELVDVVDAGKLIEIVEAGRDRGGDAIMLLQRRQQRVGWIDAAQAMQPQDVRPFAAGIDLPAAPVRQIQYLAVHFAGTGSRLSDGASAVAASRGNQLSSHSEKRGRSRGITFSANIRVL